MNRIKKLSIVFFFTTLSCFAEERLIMTSGELCFLLITEVQTMLKSRITTNKKLQNIHPGEILKEEFLVPMNISAYRLAKEVNIPQTRISEIIHGNRSITADTAIRFSKFFGTTAEFWLNLQNLYDLEEEENNHAREFEAIKMYVYA